MTQKLEMACILKLSHVQNVKKTKISGSTSTTKTNQPSLSHTDISGIAILLSVILLQTDQQTETKQPILARDSMLSTLYAITRPSVRLSVCLSVSHTGGSVENG